jgi:hemolysin III
VLEGGGKATTGLWVMWIGAALTMIRAVIWSHAPRVLRTSSYILLGFVALPMVMRLPALIGAERVWLLVLGSAVYLMGAFVYALKKPDPMPAVFGYHEVFHILVIIAAAIQFGVLLDVQYSI